MITLMQYYFCSSLIYCALALCAVWLLCGQLTGDECAYSDNVLAVSIVRDQLAATLTASAFALIGPTACYAEVCTRAESVHINCVLGRCVFLCSIVVLQLVILMKGTVKVYKHKDFSQLVLFRLF